MVGGGYEMATISEKVTNTRMQTKEALCVTRRFESLHLTLLPSRMLMRVFCPIVRVSRSVVNCAWEYCTNRRGIATQTVRHYPSRLSALTGQHFAEESFGSDPISATLHQDVEHVAVLVHSAPQGKTVGH